MGISFNIKLNKNVKVKKIINSKYYILSIALSPV